MDLGLEGKVAVITGGSEGIGRACGLRFAEEGARVVLFARRPEVLEGARADIAGRTGAEVLAVAGDVTSPGDVARLFEQAVDRFGGVDILVNNAGGSRARSFLEADDALWREDLEIKLFGALHCTRAALPLMRARGGGRIVNMTTVGGKAPRAGALPTSVSRAAGINLTKSLANELASEGILVNTICLGLHKSAQHERRWEQTGKPKGQTLEEFYREMGRRVPIGRVSEPEEVADLAVFLASARAAYITGAAVNIDGGVCPVV